MHTRSVTRATSITTSWCKLYVACKYNVYRQTKFGRLVVMGWLVFFAVTFVIIIAVVV